MSQLGLSDRTEAIRPYLDPWSDQFLNMATIRRVWILEAQPFTIRIYPWPCSRFPAILASILSFTNVSSLAPTYGFLLGIASTEPES